MKPTVGLLIPNSLPAGTVTRVALLAEELQVDQFWVPDERFYRDVYSVLSACAIQTSKITLGPCVTDPYSRHPALTAAAIATLDELSNGRAILGIGAGVSGFAEMGIARPKPTRAIKEAVELVTRLHASELVSFQGEIVSFQNGKLGVKPIQKRIPVYVASNGPMGQRVGAELADGVIMEACASAIEAGAFAQALKGHAAAANRDSSALRRIARLNMAINGNGSVAVNALRTRAARTLASGRTKFITLTTQGFEVPEEKKALVANVPYNAGLAPYERIADAVTDEMVRAVALAGSPAEIKDQILDLIKAGLTGFIISPIPIDGQSVEDVVRLFVTEVWSKVQ